MQYEVYRLREANGYILYQYAKNKIKGMATFPKYYITNKAVKYYKEFRTLPQAYKAFSTLRKVN